MGRDQHRHLWGDGPAEDTFKSCLQAAGLTSAIWIDFVKWSIDTYVAAFPNKQLFLQYAPFFDSRQERVAFTDYAASRGVGMKHNNLKPDSGDDAIIENPAVSYNTVDSTTPSSGGGSSWHRLRRV